jgi:L-lactate dehydrogenase complex protein LldG
MDTSGQAEFIRRIRSALNYPPDGQRTENNLFETEPSSETLKILSRIKNRTSDDRQKLLDALIEAAKPINLNVIPLKDAGQVTLAIVDLIRQKEPEWGSKKSIVAWKHPLIGRLNLFEALSEINVPIFFSDFKAAGADDPSASSETFSAVSRRETLRKQVIDSYIGITSADFCMADTATLVMRTRPEQARSVSLVPSIHIAVIGLHQIIADLKELYALLRWDPHEQQEGLTNCMTFISGPSKTADIEATMVHGAHGPREVHVYVITG